MTISVIIPVRNPRAAFPQTLASLAAQTHKPTEVIVVDDGSAEPVTLSQNDLSLRLITTAPQGAAQARNTGAARAIGELLFFCDADIALAPDALQRLHDTLVAQSDAAFAYGSFQWGNMHFSAPPFSSEALKKRNFISTMSMVRRNAFPGFDARLQRFQDWDLWLTVVSHGGIGVPVTGGDLFSVLAAGSMSGRGGWSRVRATRIVRKKHHLPMRLADFWLAWKEWVKRFV